jgi:hypothetical protein
MHRKLELTLRVVAMTACLGVPAGFAADAPAAGAAPSGSSEADAVQGAITRSNDVAQRAALLAEEATKQKAELEALRSRLAEDSRRRTSEAAAQAKDLQDARGRITALEAELGTLRSAAADAKAASQAQAESAKTLQQKDAEIAKLRGELGELRAAAADANAASQAQAESAKTLQQKDAEITKLRGEIEKLEKSVREARAERDGARTAASAANPAAAPSAIKPAVATAAAPAAAAASPPTEAAIPPPPDASAIKKWMKADGSLYFGERPPEGSKFVGYTTGGGL